MIDIHSHILPNIDDGARDIEETFNIINEAIEAGFTDIISTSHYMQDSYVVDKTQRDIFINDIQAKLDENNINMKLYNGAEIYISSDLDMLVKNNIVPTLNNSRYILLELPMNSKIMYLEDAIHKLLSMNLIPIIAHPERYSYVQRNPNIIIDLVQKGVLFQANYGSIIGIYGKKPKKTVEKLLKNNMIHFLGSDIHRQHTIYNNMGEILKSLEKLMNKETIKLLTQKNPMNIINNEKIDIPNPIKIRKFF